MIFNWTSIYIQSWALKFYDLYLMMKKTNISIWCTCSLNIYRLYQKPKAGDDWNLATYRETNIKTETYFLISSHSCLWELVLYNKMSDNSLQPPRLQCPSTVRRWNSRAHTSRPLPACRVVTAESPTAQAAGVAAQPGSCAALARSLETTTFISNYLSHVWSGVLLSSCKNKVSDSYNYYN